MYEVRDEHDDTVFEGTLRECAEFILDNYTDDAHDVRLVESRLEYV